MIVASLHFWRPRADQIHQVISELTTVEFYM
jgi:hypothetical protein